MSIHGFEYYRVLIVLLPAAWLAWQFVYRHSGSRHWAGYFLAYVWQFQFRLILLAVVMHAGFIDWGYAGSGLAGIRLYEVPIDVLIGTSLLFGPLVAIHFGKINPFLIIVIDWIWNMFWLPVELTMSVVIGFALISLIAVMPSLYLARWTAQDVCLYKRAVLQTLPWAVLLLWLLPSMIFTNIGHDWSVLWMRPWWLTLLMLIPLSIPVAIIASALYEFAVRGKGTAFPYDPPKYLVTTGIYRHVSNPMQIGIVLLMAGWGAILHSHEVMTTGAVAVMLFIAFKDVCNGSCQIGQNDPDWLRYQQQVRRWWPRIRN